MRNRSSLAGPTTTSNGGPPITTELTTPTTNYFEIVKETEKPVENIRHAIEWPDGERKLLSINTSPLFDDDGDFDGMVSVIGAVDVVEAMSTRRPYREVRSKARTLNVIKEGRREKFDPEVVNILINMIEAGGVKFG